MAWVTALKNNYSHRVFLSTWINIIAFQILSVIAMAVIFYYTLDYAKEIIFSSMVELLSGALSGLDPDPNTLNVTIAEVNEISLLALGVAVIFATLIAIVAAYVTLMPTRSALSMQKKFVSSVAHEMRTPLAALRTSNEVALYDLEQDSPLREIITDNIETTMHLTKVLNNILVFNRIDTGETITFEVTNLNEVVESVVRKLQKIAALKKVQITTTLTPDCFITGNKTAIEQAVYNVAKNAIAYNKPNDGMVYLQTVIQNGSASVIISDNGTGIQNKDLPHIFSPFYRAREDRSEDSNGSMGLGLALVYEVIKLHSGTISVQSEIDKGTTFTLTFSRSQEKPKTINTQNLPDKVEFNFRKP